MATLDGPSLYDRALAAWRGGALSLPPSSSFAAAGGGASPLGMLPTTGIDFSGALSGAEARVGSFFDGLASGIRETNEQFMSTLRWGTVAIVALAVIVLVLAVAYFASPVIAALK